MLSNFHANATPLGRRDYLQSMPYIAPRNGRAVDNKEPLIC